jgi:hypothetical protein
MIGNVERFDGTDELAEERVHQPARQQSGQLAATNEYHIKG